MYKTILLVIGLGVIGLSLFWLNNFIYSQKQAVYIGDYKDATYIIDGQAITLKDGFAETPAASGSNAIVTTQYFGNELTTDLNADGVEDVAFILTQTTGGSGVFYYAVGAVMTENGYEGTDGYLLGDRIAPQSTDESTQPRHVNVVVFNYTQRAAGEPMTASPTVGTSVYLKLVPETMRWAIVEENPVTEIAEDSIANLIEIFSPAIGEEVQSPLEVSGQARGYWFFEATAPVVITNWDGLIIGEGYIEATESWMTEEFVPFTGMIDYQQEPDSYSATGTIIFQKANPSALPENDAAVEITVQLQDNSI